ncbi:MAG: hydroxymethylbilane synthase [Peptostreptococcaceae bacterium]|jgi:hydroxymethylbilane synthase|nr:hydroxymethylbilane synthase [Peptostreptococcaceae bacterium]
MKLKIGTRGSKLALTQTNLIIDKLKKIDNTLDIEIKIIKTKGDIILDKALDKIGDKGLFVKEIENELLNEEIDLAVHSMKDMPSVQPQGLKLVSAFEREDYRDILITKEGIMSLDDIPKNAKIGTGSKRRKYQLLDRRNDLVMVPIRGNVETRIRKIKELNLFGVILAYAGVKRLNLDKELKDKIYAFDEDEMIPAPAQGILGLEYKENRKDIQDLVQNIIDKENKIMCDAERSYLKGLDGSCHIPMGAIAKVNGDKISIKGVYGLSDGSKLIKKEIQGQAKDAKSLGEKLANLIKEEL